MSPFEPPNHARRPTTMPGRLATERYFVEDGPLRRIAREVTGPTGTFTSHVPLLEGAPIDDARSAFDWCWLRMSTPPPIPEPCGGFRIVDLFSGCGQMTVGASEAARAVGLRSELVLAVDHDAAAADVLRKLFRDADVRQCDVKDLVAPELEKRTNAAERRLISALGDVDLLVGGPPCQGHSNLNNRTRGSDERNALALRMVRFAKLVKPRFVLMENVLGIKRDRDRVFDQIREGLEDLDYRTTDSVVKAELHGVPQRRHRVFLVAVRDSAPMGALVLPHVPERPFSWACGDLHGVCSKGLFDTSPKPTETNMARIRYLFEKRKWDLPDEQRPPCHREGGHRYKSIYGRLHWDRPAQTITTGFRSMGQGRYVHPKSRRTISPHEAARLQFIPDFVSFEGLSVSQTATLIGNAVPPKLVYAIVLNLLLSPWTLEEPDAKSVTDNGTRRRPGTPTSTKRSCGQRR